MTRVSLSRRILIAVVALTTAIGVSVVGAGPASAANTATFSGHVYIGDTSQSATAGQVKVSWANASIQLPTQLWSNAPSVMTDASGNYTISGLTIGVNYNLRFDTLSGTTGSILYRNTAVEQAVRFGDYVYASGDVTGLNVTMPKPADITGHVTLGTASAPVPAGQVRVSYQLENNQNTFTPDPTTVLTDASGNYRLPSLPAGFYDLDFTYLGTGPYLSSFYTGGVGSYTFGAHLPIQLLGTPINADMAILDKLSISGQVSLGNPDPGQPASSVLAGLGDVRVSYGYSATSATGPFTDGSGSVTTAADGSYSFTALTPGYYQLATTYLGTNGTYRQTTGYLSSSYLVHLTDTSPTSQALLMDKLITVSGHVALGTSTNSASAGAVTVGLLNPNNGVIASSTTTDAQGNYSLTGVPQGSWAIQFTYVGAGQSYVSQLNAGTVLGQREDAVVNATLALDSVVTGHVYDDQGNALPGATARIDIYDHASGAFQSYRTVTTDANGLYRFAGLPFDDYSVEFFPPTGSPDAAEAYNGVDIYYEPDYLDGSQGGTIDGVDAHLQLGGTVTGTVDVPGAPTSDYGPNQHVWVEVYVLDGPSNTWVDANDSYDVNTDHTFTISQLPPDDYKFQANYDGSLGPKSSLSGIVHVTAGHTTPGVNFSLVSSLPSGPPIGSFDAATVGPQSITVSGWALDPDTADSIPVQLYLDGKYVGQTQAEQSRPDIAAAHPAYGQYHGYAVALVGVQPGSHTVCAYGINAGPTASNTTLGCRTVTIHAPGVNGSIESITVGPGTVTVKGWEFNWSSADSQQVTLSGDFTAGVDWDTHVTADGNRPDVAAAYPGYGAAHGFTIVATGVPAGSRFFCLLASSAYTLPDGTQSVGAGLQIFGRVSPINIATGGCPTVTVPASNPFGSLDSVTTAGPGSATVSGWAIDPDVTTPIPVHVYVDGAPVIALTADGARPDIAAAYPTSGSAHGYTTTLTGLAAGTHQVCTYGINQGAGTGNSQLGCRSLTIRAGNPFGSLDAATVTGFGTVALSGWAIDPDTTTSISAHVYVDGKFSQVVTADGTRSDLAAAFPGYGSAHGISATVSGLSGGSHTICLYGINQLGGTTNPQLGCRTVTLPTGSPFGSVDTATAAAGSIALTGWALDPDTTASIAVHVYVDGAFDGVYTANGTRSDIATAFPGYGASHGYSIAAPATVGTHNVCVYAIDQASPGSNTSLGCRTVSVTVAGAV